MITMRTIVPIPMYMAWFLPSRPLAGLAVLGALSGAELDDLLAGM